MLKITGSTSQKFTATETLIPEGNFIQILPNTEFRVYSITELCALFGEVVIDLFKEHNVTIAKEEIATRFQELLSQADKPQQLPMFKEITQQLNSPRKLSNRKLFTKEAQSKTIGKLLDEYFTQKLKKIHNFLISQLSAPNFTLSLRCKNIVL